MTKTRFFGAATLLSVLIGSPASAQHMIDEPGMYAFYHPNGDLGIASARSPVDARAMAPRLVMRHHRLGVNRRSCRSDAKIAIGMVERIHSGLIDHVLCRGRRCNQYGK